jgi:hypothetical protein
MKLFLLILLLASTAWSQTDGLTSSPSAPKTQMWPDKIWNDLSREVDRSGTQLTNIIFDQIDELSNTVWESQNNSLKVGVKRSIFDNQDILNSYTVNDQFSIDLGRNGTEFSIPLVPNVATPINFNLGVGGRLVVSHLRQVFSNRFAQLPKIEDLTRDLTKESDVYEEEARKWWELDPSWRPRLAKFWNPLITTWRIPWTKEGLEKIESGDLITYSASGHVSVGLEGGFVPLRVIPGVDVSFGMGVQVYVSGEFRVTLLKESERFVRVKVTRVRYIGRGASVGATTNEVKVLDGMVLFEGKALETAISDQKITIIPFKIKLDQEHKKQFDIGYRFDLDDPKAEEAFEKAIKGNLSYAENLAKVSSTVTHILTRDALEKRKSTAVELGLKWFYKYNQLREIKDLWATIQKPDGTTEIFKSSLQLAKSWSTLWGTGEKKNFLFTTVFDKTAYEKNADNSFQLVSEALYEDVQTTGKEMKSYVHDIQTVLGGKQVIPDLPLLVPKLNSNKLKLAQYKRSSFYFGQFFSQKQVLKFLRTPSARAWEISYRSYEYVGDETQKSGLAKRFYNHWMGLQEKFSHPMSSEEMIVALQELRQLFKYQSRAVQAMRAIVMSLDGEEVDYFITATNRSFGRIQFRGRVATSAERLLQLADETVDFENRVGLYRPSLEAKITDLKVEQLMDHRIKVNFTMPKDIKFLFFKTLRSSGWKKVRNLKDFIYVNKGRFQEGANELIVGPDSEDPLEQALWNAFTTEEYYTLQVSGSLDGKSWGRIESYRFKFTPIPVVEVVPEKPTKKPKNG